MTHRVSSRARKTAGEVVFFAVTDREPVDWSQSNNGGDYHEGRTIAVREGAPFAVRYWSSYDDGCCPRCGRYDPFERDCATAPSERDFSGWASGEMLTGEAHELNLRRLQRGDFVRA